MNVFREAQRIHKMRERADKMLAKIQADSLKLPEEHRRMYLDVIWRQIWKELFGDLNVEPPKQG